jgi:Ser/Thr protein kinase RdoA (MazF antagonist)
MMYLRIPKPSYLLSQLAPRERPDAALYQVLIHLAELYQLGQIRACHRAPRSANSMNFVVTTSQGQFIFRRHRLSEETVAHEHQVLGHLQQCGFPSPRVILNQAGQAWSAIGESLYSVYEFAEGCFLSDFLWWPSARRDIFHQAGRTLGVYHQIVADLVPSFQKWDGYRPTGDKRWREGDWFRQALKDIRLLLQKRTASNPLDDFARSHIDGIEHMLRLESVVEKRSDLSKLVIHGDYAPWNILFRPGQPPFVLDFNAARLDLKIFDIVLATFWFAWGGTRLDPGRAMAFQTGYGETGQLHVVDVELASSVFRWIIARAMAERLRRHYQEHVLLSGPKGLERFYKMCVFAEQQPQQLVAGLEGITRGK